MTVGDTDRFRSAVGAARQEIDRRTFGSTQQFLAVHEVEADEHGQPRVANVFPDPNDPARFWVFFSLKGEKYFWALSLGAGSPLQLYATWIEAGTSVEFTIHSKNIDPDELSNRVGVKATKAVRKGEQRRQRAPNGKETLSPPSKGNMWSFKLESAPVPAELRLASLLDKLEPFAERIAALPAECRRTISIAYYGYRSSMGGLNFAPDMLRRVANLGADLDVDLYARGPIYPRRTSGDRGCGRVSTLPG